MFTLIGECINSSNKVYWSWHLCDNKEIANQLEYLVLDGVEKITTSFYDLYNLDNEAIPKKDEPSVVTAWNSITKCVIRTKKFLYYHSKV